MSKIQTQLTSASNLDLEKVLAALIKSSEQLQETYQILIENIHRTRITLSELAARYKIINLQIKEVKHLIKERAGRQKETATQEMTDGFLF